MQTTVENFAKLGCIQSVETSFRFTEILKLQDSVREELSDRYPDATTFRWIEDFLKSALVFSYPKCGVLAQSVVDDLILAASGDLDKLRHLFTANELEKMSSSSCLQCGSEFGIARFRPPSEEELETGRSNRAEEIREAEQREIEEEQAKRQTEQAKREAIAQRVAENEERMLIAEESKNQAQDDLEREFCEQAAKARFAKARKCISEGSKSEALSILVAIVKELPNTETAAHVKNKYLRRKSNS